MRHLLAAAALLLSSVAYAGPFDHLAKSGEDLGYPMQLHVELVITDRVAAQNFNKTVNQPGPGPKFGISRTDHWGTRPAPNQPPTGLFPTYPAGQGPESTEWTFKSLQYDVASEAQMRAEIERLNALDLSKVNTHKVTASRTVVGWPAIPH
ncbi:hypothetical protein GCM10027277_49240 [Pseudoduganella ginsengisoli]|uniref:Uncharacterized protein n=1 Tax=Pseudoduganella ginsengisoli TaxID=1462440 RepID=A0A6L6Q4S3_9BURK|nr:hypothetical protein [Pseudoduganella ginsengisoli]MTW04545.1 hypothetical protein [Pseudoduganella ginsengisoli]